jgi:uncharacterized protein
MQRHVAATQPLFMSEAAELVSTLQQKTSAELGALMRVSSKIALLNYARYQQFTSPLSADNAKPAIFSFNGDVYTPIHVQEYDEATLAFMQQYVRILSGLYGVLRPLDWLYPYRLEMGTSLHHRQHNTLYSFWGDKVTNALNTHAQAVGASVIVNLASQEYSRVIQPSHISCRYLNVEFKEAHGDGYRIVGIHAKKARGMMVDYMVRGHYTQLEEMRQFSQAGYGFSELLSDDETWVFVRG